MMKIVRFDSGEGPRIGIESGRGILDFSRAYQLYLSSQEMETSILSLLEKGLFKETFFKKVLRFVSRKKLKTKLVLKKRTCRLLAPVARPPKIIALGRNYAAHAAESGYPPPDEPIIFPKASTAVIGPGEVVDYPRYVRRLDPEVELAVVMGRRGKDIPRRRALSFVAGYTILNDVTARKMQLEDLAQSNPWYRSKSLDTFCPLGPCIVTPEEIGSRIELALELRVNGRIRQKDNTRSLIFKVPALIEYISGFMSLEPGDIISTGTPAGIGPVYPGDVMEARIERIGCLKNPVGERSP